MNDRYELLSDGWIDEVRPPLRAQRELEGRLSPAALLNRVRL